MASSRTGISGRTGLAIAAAITGLTLAGGVSVASLVGWIRPALPATDTLQASVLEQVSVPANTQATPQVVLVPVAPVTTSAQQAPTAVSVPGAELTSGRSTDAGAFVASRQVERSRSDGARVPHAERDDD